MRAHEVKIQDVEMTEQLGGRENEGRETRDVEMQRHRQIPTYRKSTKHTQQQELLWHAPLITVRHLLTVDR